MLCVIFVTFYRKVHPNPILDWGHTQTLTVKKDLFSISPQKDVLFSPLVMMLFCVKKIIDRLEILESGKQKVPQTFSEALQLAADQAKQIEEQQKVIEQKDEKITKLQPKADFADAAFITDDKVDIGMAAKILKLGFGRNTLFQKLRQVGVFFSNRNEPKQRFVNAGYFEMKEKFIERNSHPGFVVTKILVTQKGLAYINHLFGGNPSDGKIAAIE